MQQLKQYITDTLGIEALAEPVLKKQLGNLPMFLSELYGFYNIELFDQDLILAEPRSMEEFSILMAEKHIKLLQKFFNKKVVLLLPELAAFNRKRLIDKKINFIVPGKQLYLPDLLVDLRENAAKYRTKRKIKKLLPSAQFLIIYNMLHQNNNWKIENHSFKELANKLGYTAMAITNAIEDLKNHDVINITGYKEKFIQFKFKSAELWKHLENQDAFVNPVLKKVYVDKKPQDVYLLHSNISALSEYSDINPGSQEFYAIEKNEFYNLKKNNALLNINDHEGQYCLEIWKYNPKLLVTELQNRMSVDPLSLYLTIKGSRNERIEMALDQIINKFIW